MTLAKIEALLSQRIGLDPETIGLRKISKAIEHRQQHCGLPDLSQYFQKLETSPVEFEALVEQIVIPETWFFRDRKPFDFLKQQVMTAEFWEHRTKLRLLSMPCSSGEEPYSMAITLLEAGLKPEQFTIDAIDISHKVLAKASKGLYTRNSFRGEEMIDRQRYFRQKEDGSELVPEIRQLVNFKQGNVLTFFSVLAQQYDIIFCRNLLIYLEPEACTQVMHTIDRLLTPGGLLFVGAAETSKVPSPSFESVRQPFTFAYRKSVATQPTKLPALQPPIEPPFMNPKPSLRDRSIPVMESATMMPIAEVLMKAQSVGSDREATNPADFKTVKNLANQGRLQEARLLCQRYLNQNRTHAEAHMLLGELYQAEGNDSQAEQAFRKALYLDPNSYEALLHLVLLREQQGDAAGAKILHQRIQRLQRIAN